MIQEIEVVNGTEIDTLNEVTQNLWDNWKDRMGPPVPVIIDGSVWKTLKASVIDTIDPINKPRVFRLFMKRGKPRYVVDVSEIKQVRRNERGILTWKEGEYPPKSKPLRKGGNVFIRGDVQLQLHDAWWMAREETELRILLAKENDKQIVASAWWVRQKDTDGDLWPVKLLIDQF